MIAALATLLACQFVGEIVSNAFGLPLPGPVIGLLILLVLLTLRGVTPAMRGTAQTLLQHLSLLFVPAGVGVVSELHALGGNLVAIAVAIVVSTALGLAVAAWVMQRLARPGA